MAIKTLSPRERTYTVYDRDGLFLLVNSGGSKSWHRRHRSDHKKKLMALGEYQVVTLRDVRDGNLAARKVLSAGLDSMAERKAEPEDKQNKIEARERESEERFEKVARRWRKWWAAGKSSALQLPMAVLAAIPRLISTPGTSWVK